MLKLYAPGSNGEINFIADVTFGSESGTTLAGFGGTNPDNGTFGGNGANDPQPLGNAPPFDPPPAGK